MKWVKSYCGMRNAECGMAAIRSLLLVFVCVLAQVSFAQDTNNPEEIKKNLADALNQLKAAQDRKNELANENESLKAKIAELEKQVHEQKGKVAELEDKSWFWRSHYFAWVKFIERYPKLLAQWKVFLEANPLDMPSLLPVWDESMAVPVTVEGESTQKIDATAKVPAGQ